MKSEHAKYIGVELNSCWTQPAHTQLLIQKILHVIFARWSQVKRTKRGREMRKRNIKRASRAKLHHEEKSHLICRSVFYFGFYALHELVIKATSVDCSIDWHVWCAESIFSCDSNGFEMKRYSIHTVYCVYLRPALTSTFLLS